MHIAAGLMREIRKVALWIGSMAKLQGSPTVDDFSLFFVFFFFFKITIPEQWHRLPFMLPETSKGGTEDLPIYCFPLTLMPNEYNMLQKQHPCAQVSC